LLKLQKGGIQEEFWRVRKSDHSFVLGPGIGRGIIDTFAVVDERRQCEGTCSHLGSFKKAAERIRGQRVGKRVA
jgi:hypothetical protein